MKVISFCLYGNHPKYVNGLFENMDIINTYLIDFMVYLYLGNDVSEEVVSKCKLYKNIRMILVDANNAVLMMHRCFPIDDNIEVLFCRDLDSRINARDRWTMDEFIRSDKHFHIVRDHYYHKSRIMAGIWGIKKHFSFNMKQLVGCFNDEIKYGMDELFLQENVYPLIKDDVLIHSNISGFLNEIITPIEYPLNQPTDFIGNVIDYKEKDPFYQFTYQYPIEQFNFLYQQEQWKLMILVSEHTDISLLTPDDITQVFYKLYMANYYCGNFIRAQDSLRRCTTVDDHIIVNSSYLLKQLNKTIVATTVIDREPLENEIVIVYGNFHHAMNNLPIENKLYRHPIYFTRVEHDLFEFDECWNSIDQIYILNLIERRDRYLEILVELCRMNAPLHRIYPLHSKKIDSTYIQQLYEVGKSHISVIKHFIGQSYKHCMILEDDVTFTSNIPTHKYDLQLFMERHYDYDICLITSSKYGLVKPYDDLLSLSYQPCTTSSGYILNSSTVQKILDVLEEGNQKLLATNDASYCCDRYWQKLQNDGKFFVFNDKFGYQRPTYSSITKSATCHFD